jgi:TonB-dependent SusC/RagA subfamily outer membrane receptor
VAGAIGIFRSIALNFVAYSFSKEETESRLECGTDLLHVPGYRRFPILRNLSEACMKILLRYTRLFVCAILAVVFAFPAIAQGQAAVVTGRILSEQGQPLAGANVTVPELNISVATNQVGNYTISVPAARVSGQSVVVRARAIGFAPQSRPVTLTAGTQTVSFDLKKDITELSAVVVTGVTTATEQRKLAFTVTRVDSSMMPVAGSNPITQIQGKVPGAMIMNPSGRPGAAPQVILRGPVSLNATGRTQQPLYLLDGVPLQGSLPDINPDDIAGVEIVKGAAAASLYGARAGAGVINITTKTGRNSAEGIRVGLRTELGKSDIEREFPLARFSALALDPSGTRFCSRDFLQNAATGTSSLGWGFFSPCARYIVWDDEVERINNSGVDFSLPAQNFLQDFGITNTPSYEQLTGLYIASAWRTRTSISAASLPTRASTRASRTLSRRGRFASFPVSSVTQPVSTSTKPSTTISAVTFIRSTARAWITPRSSTRRAERLEPGSI